jgi:4-hydroxy 2-oxovalerate aldolase
MHIDRIDAGTSMSQRPATGHIDLVECTLRDGGYAIDFQFTADDTFEICQALEKAGFRDIEIGHGCGLGASGPRLGRAAASDEEYIRAAAAALTEARFGAFFIAGIGTIKHLEDARKLGMHFVRVGTNITQSDQAEPYIKAAKSLDFIVSYNGMKSYSVSPAEYLDRARRAVDWGADCVSLVDSAGGMLPGEVREYIGLLRKNLPVKIAFHGHNNLMLANANGLAAIEAGASVLDTTMGGLGRSAGNAPSEIMVMILEKMGLHTGVDPYEAMDVAEKLVKPRVANPAGVSALDLTMGYAQFHSSFLPLVEKAAAEWNVDPKRLIIEVSKQDKESPSEQLIVQTAERLSAAQPLPVLRLHKPAA